MSDVQPMALHEAIRLGAMMKPQAFGSVFDGLGTCALGAACDAAGVLDAVMSGDRTKARAILPFARTLAPPCPACGTTEFGFFGEGVKQVQALIAHLNDYHIWSREQIADYVQSIEQQQSSLVDQGESVTVGA